MIKQYKKRGAQLAAAVMCTSLLPASSIAMAEEKTNNEESVSYEKHSTDKIQPLSNDLIEDNKTDSTTDSAVKISENIGDLNLENQDNILKDSSQDVNIKIKMQEIKIKLPTGGVLPTIQNEISEEDAAKLPEYNPEENKIKRTLFFRNRRTNYYTDYAFKALGDFENGENMQNAYNGIVTYLNKVHNGEINIDSNLVEENYCLSKVNIYKYNLTKDELFKVFLSIRADHPEFFWLSNEYSYGVSEQDNNKVICFIPQVLSHYKTRDERSDMNEKLENAISDFLNEIDGDTDFEKELQIHDKIARETVYDYYFPYSLNDYNIAGVLVDHVGVCESYAKTMQLLLNACGIDNIYVAGTVNTGNGNVLHAWNQVCIEGNYYNVDSVWDDQYSGTIYEYFNVKDEDFGYHNPFTPDDSEYQYPIKKCNSDEADYYCMMSKTKYVLDSKDKIEEFVKERTIESLKSLEDNKFTIVMVGKTSEITEEIISYLGKNFAGLLKNDKDVNDLWVEKCDTNSIDCQIYGKTVNIYLYPKDQIPVTQIEIPKKLNFDKLLNAIYIVPTISPSYAADVNNQQWTSGDENVVLVNNGEIIVVGEGETDVTVKTGGKEAVCHIKVKFKDYPIQQEIPVSSFKVSPNNAELYESGIKSTQQFKVTLEPDNATDKEVIWYCDDNNIVEINQDGLATAVGVGKTTIYCIPNGLIEGGKYSKYEVTVRPVTKISEIQITGSNVINVKGGSINLSAIVSPDDATYTDVIWTIDSGDDIAQIDSSGKLTAKGTGNGNVTVRATANDGSETFETKTVTLSNQVEILNKTDLQALYDANKDKTQVNYTSASWTTFSTALSNAKNILDKADAAQSEVDAAKSELQTAIDGLKRTSSSSSSSSSSKHKQSSDDKENEQSKVNVFGNENSIINTLYTNTKVEIKSTETETAVTETGEDCPVTVITTSENKQIKTLKAQTDGRLTVKGDSDEHVYAFVPQINKYVEIPAEKTENNVKFNKIKDTIYVITEDNQQLNVTNKGWNKENNDWYYIDSNGQVKTGWLNDNNRWYNLNSQGKMQTGWLDEGEKWYYMKPNGEMATGWQQIENKWYYLRANGTMQKGWMWEGGNWYYLCENGEMATGWQHVGSQWYYLYGNGEMAANTTISGYRVGADGAWIK